MAKKRSSKTEHEKPMKERVYKRLERVLEAMKYSSEGEPFFLHEISQLASNAIDRIERKVSCRKAYNLPSKFVEDVNLMLTNCLLYDSKESDIVKLTLLLEKAFIREWKYFFPFDPEEKDAKMRADKRRCTHMLGALKKNTLVVYDEDGIMCVPVGLGHVIYIDQDEATANETQPLPPDSTRRRTRTDSSTPTESLLTSASSSTPETQPPPPKKRRTQAKSDMPPRPSSTPAPSLTMTLCARSRQEAADEWAGPVTSSGLQPDREEPCASSARPDRSDQSSSSTSPSLPNSERPSSSSSEVGKIYRLAGLDGTGYRLFQFIRKSGQRASDRRVQLVLPHLSSGVLLFPPNQLVTVAIRGQSPAHKMLIDLQENKEYAQVDDGKLIVCRKNEETRKFEQKREMSKQEFADRLKQLRKVIHRIPQAFAFESMPYGGGLQTAVHSATRSSTFTDANRVGDDDEEDEGGDGEHQQPIHLELSNSSAEIGNDDVEILWESFSGRSSSVVQQPTAGNNAPSAPSTVPLVQESDAGQGRPRSATDEGSPTSVSGASPTGNSRDDVAPPVTSSYEELEVIRIGRVDELLGERPQKIGVLFDRLARYRQECSFARLSQLVEFVLLRPHLFNYDCVNTLVSKKSIDYRKGMLLMMSMSVQPQLVEQLRQMVLDDSRLGVLHSAAETDDSFVAFLKVNHELFEVSEEVVFDNQWPFVTQRTFRLRGMYDGSRKVFVPRQIFI